MNIENEPSDTTKDRVQRLPRLLGVFIVPVLVLGFLLVYVFPHDTGRLFAWEIRPPTTAMMLGATYLGGAYFFARVAFARRWHHVTLGFLPVAAFCVVLSAATALHWDLFTQGHPVFILWVVLYFSLPFVLPLAWYRNHRAAGADEVVGGPRLSSGLVAAFLALGTVFTVVGLLLFFVPQWMIPGWPWEITPLTARVLSSMFVLTGLIALGIGNDRRWLAARYMLQAQTLAVALMLVAVALARADFDWASPASWLFVGLMVFVLGVIVSVQVRYGNSVGPERSVLGRSTSVDTSG